MVHVLVVGIDGGSFNIIEPLIEKGLLPNFKRLISGGVKSYLESTIHPSSEQAWPSFSLTILNMLSEFTSNRLTILKE